MKNSQLLRQQKRQFYRDLLRMSIPIVLQNLISAAVTSADVFMLGFVGESALSAVSLANQLQFLLVGFFFGICSATCMLVSQYWGKEDMRSIQAVMGISFKLSFAVTSLAACAALFAPGLVMRIFTPDPELIEIGSRYLRAVGISYVLMSVSQVYESTMRSLERPHVSTLLSSIALSLNIFLNAVFIFGFFGAPKLGVLGVAAATVIARTVEVLLCLADAARSKVMNYDLSILLGSHPLLLRDFIRFAVPALINDMVWTVAFSSYSVIYGHLGSDVVAANAVAGTVRSLLTSAAYGLGSAGTVLLGKSIGANEMEEARANGDALCRVSFFIGAATGGLILLLRPLIFAVYGPKLTETGLDLLNFMLLISSYYVIGQIMNTLVIAGIFRAGGDSRFGMILDLVNMWLIAVPVSFFCAFVLHLPVKWVCFVICLDEFYKIPVVYHHYKKYTWLKNITRDYE